MEQLTWAEIYTIWKPTSAEPVTFIDPLIPSTFSKTTLQGGDNFTHQLIPQKMYWKKADQGLEFSINCLTIVTET